MNEDLNHAYAGEILEEEDSFRLISLQPGDHDEQLTLRLINTRLKDPQPYEAVSYVWGDASQQVLLRVHDKNSDQVIMGVTPNCHSALKRLRNKESARTLWIDSICINQSLNMEKNHQLALMARIYQEATRVIVYLGEGTSDTDAAMKYISEVDDPSDFGTGGTADNQLLDEKSWLDVFFQRPWFHRVWVLQEITFAKQAMVVCGNQELDWQSFLTFYHWNVSNRVIGQLPYSLKYSTSPVAISGPWLMYAARLLKMLTDTRHCGATDPRDKLYAILPLLSRDHDQFVLELSESLERFEYDDDEIKDIEARKQRIQIPVDYGRSQKAVFTDLAMLLLETIGLDTLKSVVRQPQIPGLPSWVPDWSTANPYWSTRNPPRDMGHMAGFDGDPDYLLGRARPRPQRLLHWTTSEYASAGGDMAMQLHLDVVRVGEITKLGDLCDINKNTLPLSQWESLVPNKTDLQGRERPDGLSPDEALEWWNGPKELSPFARTVTEDDVVYPQVVRRALDFIKLYNGDVPKDKEKEAKKANYFWDDKYDNEDRLTLKEIFKKGPSYETQAQFILRHCDGKRFFVTDTGFIGLAPDRAQVGDVVHFVRGASVPFVFRRGSSYGTDSEGKEKTGGETPYVELVGECFAYGVMAGDVWDDVAKKTRRVDKIVVR